MRGFSTVGKLFKKAFELSRVGVNGLATYPNASVLSLLRWQRRNELVFACVNKKAEAAQDPEPIVERRSENGLWEEVPGHPLRRLMMRPNPEMTGSDFMSFWVTSEQVAGFFAAEIVRSPSGLPAQLWPLNPAWVRVKNTGDIEYGNGQKKVVLSRADVFYTRLTDLSNPFSGISPLAVALGSVEADSQQTDYVRTFFEKSAIPSGILKIKGRTLTDTFVEQILSRWKRRYGKDGDWENGPAVLDDGADYQKIGSSLNELDNSILRQQTEARICSAFGVPPLLVGAFVGLVNVNQKASAVEANRDFWINTMSPLFKRFRTILTWQLLPEFEGIGAVRLERVRVAWDMGNVMGLQEDVASKHLRAREDFRAGAITLNTFEATVGLPPTSGGDYYLRPVNRIPVTPAVVTAQAAAAAQVAQDSVAVILTGSRDVEGEGEGEGKSRRKKKGAWKYVSESDENRCKWCEEADGETAAKESDLTPVPNPNCGDGYGKCRCRHEFVEE